MDKSNTKRKVTLYLDTGSIDYLKTYSLEVLKSGSISAAVRTLAKEHETHQSKKPQIKNTI